MSASSAIASDHATRDRVARRKTQPPGKKFSRPMTERETATNAPIIHHALI